MDEQAILDLLYNTVFDAQTIDRVAKINEFDFTGFDPKVIAKTIFDAGMKKGRKVEEIKMDIMIMCLIGAKRGFRIDKIMKSISKEGTATLARFGTMYGLQTTVVAKTALQPNTITLARVVAAFPVIFLQIFSSPKVYRYIGLSSYGDLNFPPLFACSMGAIFVSDADWVNWLKWAREYSFIISKGDDSGWSNTYKIILAQRKSAENYMAGTIQSVATLAKDTTGSLLMYMRPTAFMSPDDVETLSAKLKEVLDKQREKAKAKTP